MKNLIYLFAAVIMFAFTACGGGEATEDAAPAAAEAPAADEAAAAADEAAEAEAAAPAAEAAE